jgi:hypothetical protein
VGTFPALAPTDAGAFIGCEVDDRGDIYVSKLYFLSIHIDNRSVTNMPYCHSTSWPRFSGLPSLSFLQINQCDMNGVFVEWTEFANEVPSLQLL